MRDAAGPVLVLAVAACAVFAASGCARHPEQDLMQSNAGASAPAPDQAADDKGDGTMPFSVASTAFTNGDRIPAKYTADGEDVSPPLSWTAPPEGAAELALICDDPDAPVGTWNHWVLYGLAPDADGLPEGLPRTATVDAPECKQGLNTWPKLGYWGPAPPKGKPHRYQFTVYALSEKLDLEPEAAKEKLLAAMQGKVLAKATVEGVYSR